MLVHRPHLADGYTTLLWMALAAALVLGIYWSTVADLGLLWASTQDYGHGYLIAPITLFLIWRNRAKVCAGEMKPFWGAGVWCVGASVGWLAAYVIGIQVGMQLALLGVLLTALWMTLGWPIFRWLLFPIGYLVFAIPVWSVVVPPLQGLTADMATTGVRWIGIPVFREGPFLTIPEGRFEIAEVCAGLRFLMASMSLAALYGYLNFEDTGRRLVFFALGVVWAVFFNWVRVIIVIWLGYTLGMDAALVQDHNSVGWVLFALSLVPLFAIGAVLQKPHDISAGPEELPDQRPVEGGKSPSAVSPNLEHARSTVRPMVAVLMALIFASVGPAGAIYLESAGGPNASDTELPPMVTPAVVDGWIRTDDGLDWQPAYQAADATQAVSYAREGSVVSIFVARYVAQRQGKELVSDLNFPYDPNVWSVFGREPTVWVVDGRPVSAARLLLQGPRGRERWVEFVYAVGGRPAIGGMRTKLAQLWGFLRGRTDAAVIAVAGEGRQPSVDPSRLVGAIARMLVEATP